MIKTKELAEFLYDLSPLWHLGADGLCLSDDGLIKLPYKELNKDMKKEMMDAAKAIIKKLEIGND
jgi:hypothetical protein